MIEWDFTFDGDSATDKGLIVTKIRRPMLPELRSRKLVVPGKDGAWDFGNNTYEEQTISVECILDRPFFIQNTVRSLSAWLSAKGQLIFNDEPEKYYVGRIYSATPMEIDGQIGIIIFEFIVEPFAYSLLSTGDEILLGDDIPLQMNVNLDNSDLYSYDIIEETDVTIDNFGSRDIRPTIIINGSFTDLSITANGGAIAYGSTISSEELIIDGENYTAELDGVNVLSDISGDFLVFSPGDNDVNISGTDLNFTIIFKFRPTFY